MRPRSVRGRGSERTTLILRRATKFAPRGGPRGSGFTGGVHFRPGRPALEQAVLMRLTQGPASSAELNEALGYEPKSTGARRAANGLVEEGVAERIPGRPPRYRLTDVGRQEASGSS